MSRSGLSFLLDRIPVVLALVVSFLILAVPVFAQQPSSNTNSHLAAISEEEYVRRYCYSGWCASPGGSAYRYSSDAVQSAIKEINQTQKGQAKAIETGEVNADNFVSKTVLDALQAGIFLNVAGGKIIENDGVASVDQGLVGHMGNAIAFMYSTPPANTQTYIADVLNSAGVGIVQPAYAQGIGFSALNPVLSAWKTFRNIAYLFFVLAILVIGFMIMLRRKVGQAAITAQQAIPKIIMALLTVTFSYAIAGLLIDAMYLIMFLIIGIFGEEASAIDTSIFELALRLIGAGVGDAYTIVADVVGDIVTIPIIKEASGILGGITAAVVVAIAIAVAIFKLFFELLTTYITILISVVMAPIQLMFDAIPGRNSFASWMRNMVGNLLTFPTVLIIMVIYDQLTVNKIEDGGFAPPFMIGAANQADIIPFIIGLGIILALPEAIKKMKQQMGVSDGPFGEIIKAGWTRARQQRAGIALGSAASGGIVGAAGGGLAGLYRAARGEGTMRERVGRFARTTASGAGIGGVLGPATASGLPWRFVKGAASDLGTIGRQYIIANKLSGFAGGFEPESQAQTTLQELADDVRRREVQDGGRRLRNNPPGKDA